MPVVRQVVEQVAFNRGANLPFQLRIDDFALAMQDIYDFFHDVNGTKTATLHRDGIEKLRQSWVYKLRT